MKNRQTILLAKLFTLLFEPHYFPLLCMLVLMGFSYMKIFPLQYKVFVLVVVYVFTIALPVLLIALYRHLNGLHRHQLTHREMRTVPYIISTLCYVFCYQLMRFLGVPRFIVSVVLASVVLQMLCLLINMRYKISIHSAAAGAMNGALVAFSLIFHFDPTWWLCLTLIIAGCVGTSRLILRRHSLMEVNLGLAVGLVVGFITILIF